MQQFSQKYSIVYTFDELSDGFEFSMKDWPLHISLAELFSIKGTPSDLLASLAGLLQDQKPVETKVIGEDWFGEDKSAHVKLFENTDELQSLHGRITEVLAGYSAEFNNPQYIHEGFKPHSTIKGQQQVDGFISINSLTLIDMFPNEDPYQRKVLGTVRFL